MKSKGTITRARETVLAAGKSAAERTKVLAGKVADAAATAGVAAKEASTAAVSAALGTVATSIQTRALKEPMRLLANGPLRLPLLKKSSPKGWLLRNALHQKPNKEKVPQGSKRKVSARRAELFASATSERIRMILGRLLAIGVSFIAAFSVHRASAQFCDDRFPWTCQEPRAPIDITPVPRRFDEAAPAQPGNVDPALGRQYAVLYGPVSGERFPIPAIRLSDINPVYLRTAVIYPTHEPPGTIVIDPQNHFLYLVQGGGRALRYGVGVGRQGFGWSGG